MFPAEMQDKHDMFALVESLPAGDRLDSLVREFYANANTIVRYSADWDSIHRLAADHGLDLRPLRIGDTCVVEVFVDGEKQSGVGTGCEAAKLSDVVALLSARVMLKWVAARGSEEQVERLRTLLRENPS